MPEGTYCQLEVLDPGIAKITLNRPERLNACTPAMHRELDAHVRRCRDDDSIRAVVVTGAGRAFCAGAELVNDEEGRGGLGQARNVPPGGGPRTYANEAAPWEMTAIPKPVIAMINGPAVGWGAELTLHCDLRVASENARIGWVFSQRSLVPDTGAGPFLLPRLVGLDHALEILYSGEVLSAQRARELGIFTHLVAQAELEKFTFELATKLARCAPLSAAHLKRLAWRGLSQDLEASLLECTRVLNDLLESEDLQEGIAAFLERRLPEWKGR